MITLFCFIAQKCFSLSTAEMVKKHPSLLKTFYCECHFLSSAGSILKSFIHPVHLIKFLKNRVGEIVRKFVMKQSVYCLFPVSNIYACVYLLRNWADAT